MQFWYKNGTSCTTSRDLRFVMSLSLSESDGEHLQASSTAFAPDPGTSDEVASTPDLQFASRFNQQQPGPVFGFSGFHGNDGIPPLVFSHLEHTTSAGEESAGHVPVPFQGGMERSHHYTRNVREREGHLEGREGESGDDGGVQDTHLLTRLQSLSVSPPQAENNLLANGPAPQFDPNSPPRESTACGNHTQWAWSRGSHGNCRDEALGVVYVDDVTVDDLAGYFDQMLHLPRPMSDMAQLMYT